jgi:hypothetical protein
METYIGPLESLRHPAETYNRQTETYIGPLESRRRPTESYKLLIGNYNPPIRTFTPPEVNVRQ